MANDDIDLSNYTRRFKELREERDLLKSQVHELEKNLAAVEAVKSRLESELEHITAQFDSLKAMVTEKETIIQSIAATILTHVKKNEKPEILPGLGRVSAFAPKPLPERSKLTGAPSGVTRSENSHE